MFTETIEGKTLPAHCVKGTNGQRLILPLRNLIPVENRIFKSTFATDEVGRFIRNREKVWDNEISEIQVIGYCTSICVAAMCITLRKQFPEVKIKVFQDLCGDINEESHKAALTMLKNQMIKVV